MKVNTDPEKLPKLEVPLDVLVIGGGWGGLTAAMAFKRRGCNVTVLEGATEFKSIGGMLVSDIYLSRTPRLVGLELRYYFK